MVLPSIFMIPWDCNYYEPTATCLLVELKPQEGTSCRQMAVWGIEPGAASSSDAQSWKKMVSPSPIMINPNCNHQETLTSCLWVLLKVLTGFFLENFQNLAYKWPWHTSHVHDEWKSKLSPSSKHPKQMFDHQETWSSLPKTQFKCW